MFYNPVSCGNWPSSGGIGPRKPEYVSERPASLFMVKIKFGIVVRLKLLKARLLNDGSVAKIGDKYLLWEK
jgi:hypothetical protein